MPKDGKKTKERILDAATQLAFQYGFSGTTIDNILANTNLTKGALFYHFKDKAVLALEMIKHFRNADMAILEMATQQANENSTTPTEKIMTFVQWFIDFFEQQDEPHEGCLYATFIYEPMQVSDEVKEIVADALLMWRQELGKMLRDAGMNADAEVDSLSDMFSVVLEGSFITSKALNDPLLTAKQLKHYKKYLELLLL